jgi:hypothetical protein
VSENTDPDRLRSGLPDHVYDLVVLLQQAAEDVVRYERFADDARLAADHEFADWCVELADSDREIVARAQSMLAARLTAGTDAPRHGRQSDGG